MSNVAISDRVQGSSRSFVVRHPIGVLLVAGTAFVWITQMASLLAGADVMPAKLGEIVVLLGLAVWISARVGGRREVGRLFAGLRRWRLGRRYLWLIGAMPLLTTAV